MNPAPDGIWEVPTEPPTRPAALLDWRAGSHWSTRPGLCRWCRLSTHLRDSEGRHSHKVCAEAHGGT